MKKRSCIFFLCICCTAMLLSGCARPTDLTDAERDAIAEYVAYLLLKYDRDYESRLVETITVSDKPSMVEEEFGVIGEDKPSKEGNTSSEDSNSPKDDSAGQNPSQSGQGKTVTLAELFADRGVQVTFDGYQEYSSYPEGEESFFSLVAPEGKKLAIMKFTIQNTSKKKQKFSQADSDIRYRLEIGETTVLQPDMTLLTDDLQYLDTVLKPEEKKEAVVVFTVDQKIKLAGASLVACTETEAASETLK